LPKKRWPLTTTVGTPGHCSRSNSARAFAHFAGWAGPGQFRQQTLGIETGAFGRPPDRRRLVDVQPCDPRGFEQSLIEEIAPSRIGCAEGASRQFFAIERRGAPIFGPLIEHVRFGVRHRDREALGPAPAVLAVIGAGIAVSLPPSNSAIIRPPLRGT